jgi:hypothetical protein
MIADIKIHGLKLCYKKSSLSVYDISEDLFLTYINGIKYEIPIAMYYLRQYLNLVLGKNKNPWCFLSNNIDKSSINYG